jgi:hypothetical protein
MVGCLNTFLPVRSTIDPEAKVLPWLVDFQERLAELREFEYTSLPQIADWAATPETRRLFDVYLVFENYPFERRVVDRLAAWDRGTGMTLTEHALRFEVWPQTDIAVFLAYYRDCLDDATVAQMARDLETLLDAFRSAPDSTLGEIARHVGLEVAVT